MDVILSSAMWNSALVYLETGVNLFSAPSQHITDVLLVLTMQCSGDISIKPSNDSLFTNQIHDLANLIRLRRISYWMEHKRRWRASELLRPSPSCGISLALATPIDAFCQISGKYQSLDKVLVGTTALPAIRFNMQRARGIKT